MAKKQIPDILTLRKHFIDSLYRTLDGVVSPTPYLEVVEGDKVGVHFLNGQGKLPSHNSTEVTVLDIDLASLFFDDFNVLYEGVTGVGKTYTSDALADAVVGPDGYCTLRLSGGIMGTSALEPFTITSLENGVPKSHVDFDKCQEYGILFIDEINRGDAQEVFQVVDGKIHVNGDTGYLRIPISGREGAYKKLAIIAAMNPADAEHNAALDLDIAGENRFLKFRFPNGVGEAGSSQLEKSISGDLHERFWNEFSKRSGQKGNWREWYPLIADSSQISSELDGESREFIDSALGFIGYDPNETFERNIELMKQAGLEPRLVLAKGNDYDLIREKQGVLKHGFVRRDLSKIRDLSRLLAFIKGIKQGTYESDVKVNDVVASMGVILESKTITGSDYGKLMTLVNDAQKQFGELKKAHNIPDGYGLRQSVWQSAVNAGKEHGIDGYFGTLDLQMNALNSRETNPARVVILSRALSDLAVLRHFSETYEQDVAQALKEKDAFGALVDVYKAKKSKASIYEHRLSSIMG